MYVSVNPNAPEISIALLLTLLAASVAFGIAYHVSPVSRERVFFERVGAFLSLVSLVLISSL